MESMLVPLLFAISAITGLNSVFQGLALIKVTKIEGTLNEHLKNCATQMNGHTDRITRLEDTHMKGD